MMTTPMITVMVRMVAVASNDEGNGEIDRSWCGAGVGGDVGFGVGVGRRIVVAMVGLELSFGQGLESKPGLRPQLLRTC